MHQTGSDNKSVGQGSFNIVEVGFFRMGKALR